MLSINKIKNVLRINEQIEIYMPVFKAVRYMPVFMAVR